MIEFTRREQIGALVLAGLLVVGIFIRFAVLPTDPGDIVIEDPVHTEAETEQKAAILIHVAGAVLRPGVYELQEGDRVLDAVEAAGGSLEEGDPHALNLAEPLYDGRRITVPYIRESGVEVAPESGKININTATAAEFESLPGIGPAKAGAIADFREQHGPFTDLADLALVPGIGPKTVESLKEYITLY
ncbi:MAG: ComEA family DNA-binding protein [Bacillota bacterium]|nr:ComEA family DNA-binding protein [Bacillota bacterium]MDW7683430.1 ComEA family DNA-binding protein [Bacillota bacterium]